MVSFLQLFIAVFCAVFVAASPVDFAQPVEGGADVSLEKRQTDWGNYVYISSVTSGLIGQNIALIATPGNRAACPGAVYDLQTCSESWVSTCIEERFAFEWCLQHRITVATCAAQWINMTLGCMGHSSAYCVETLITLQLCAEAVTIPTLPPP